MSEVVLRKLKRASEVLKTEGIGGFMIKMRDFLKLNIRPLYIRIWIRPRAKIVKKQLSEFSSADNNETFNFIFRGYLGVFGAMQIKEEFLSLLDLLKKERPHCIMEIGTAYGGTLFSFLKTAPDDSVVISLDLPGGNFGGGYKEWKIAFFEAMKKTGQRLCLIREDSHQERTLSKIKHILDDHPIDFLFIDGDHTYEGVKKDFQMYGSLVRKGGLIAFHDIINQSESGADVAQLWKEVVPLYDEHWEFIKDRGQNGFGIGVLRK